MNAPSLSPRAALALPLHPSLPQTCHLALVTRVERGVVTVIDEDGAVVDIAGVVDVGVGDHVVVNDAGAVVDVVPRRSALWRAREQGGAQLLAANVDVVFCVVAADQGLRPRRLERALALAYDSGAEPVVVITKADLVDDAALAALVWQSEGLAPGVAVVSTSTHRTGGVDALRALLLATDDDGEPRARVAVMLGVSGAGKSALTNALLGKDVITEGALSADGLRGAHTTTSRRVHLVPGGGVVIDTPGCGPSRWAPLMKPWPRPSLTSKPWPRAVAFATAPTTASPAARWSPSSAPYDWPRIGVCSARPSGITPASLVAPPSPNVVGRSDRLVV